MPLAWTVCPPVWIREVSVLHVTVSPENTAAAMWRGGGDLDGEVVGALRGPVLLCSLLPHPAPHPVFGENCQCLGAIVNEKGNATTNALWISVPGRTLRKPSEVNTRIRILSCVKH